MKRVQDCPLELLEWVCLKVLSVTGSLFRSTIAKKIMTTASGVFSVRLVTERPRLSIAIIAFAWFLVHNLANSPRSFGQTVRVEGPSSADVERVLLAIDKAKAELSTKAEPDALKAADAVQRDWAALKDYLRATTDLANQQAWLDYIGLDPLIELLDEHPTREQLQENSTARRAFALSRGAYFRMKRNLEGLERESITALRESVARLQVGLNYLVSKRTAIEAKLGGNLDEIRGILADSQRPFTAEQIQVVNSALRELDESGFAPEVVEQVTALVCQPNVRISIGKTGIRNIVNRPIYDSGPNSDCILGTRVLSQTHLEGQLTPVLIPNSNKAHIQLVIDASFSSQGTGFNSGVRIYNRTHGPVRSVRDLFITESGLSVGDVHSTANLETEILGIQHPLRIVRRIASKRAAQQRSAATRIAEARLESRVSNQFEQQSGQQISQGNLLPRAAAQDVLVRLGLTQPSKQWSTVSDYVRLQLNVRNPGQITTLTSPPEVVPGFDVVVQFHETSIVNHADRLLAGRTLTDKEIRTFITNLLPQTLNVERAMGAEALSDDSGIAEVAQDAVPKRTDNLRLGFDEENPLIFEAREGKVRIGANMASIVRDDEVLNEPTAIWADYLPVRESDGKVVLQRVGEVSVLVKRSGKDRFYVRRIPIVARLKGALNNVFPEKVFDKSLGESIPAMKRFSPDPLNIKAIRPRDGWITVYAE